MTILYCDRCKRNFCQPKLLTKIKIEYKDIRYTFELCENCIFIFEKIMELLNDGF